MSKAYIITAEYYFNKDGKKQSVGAYFDRDQARKALKEVVEKDHALWDGSSCYGTWGIQEVEVQIPLTPLQITNLNGIGLEIQRGDGDFFSYEDSLSDEEAAYLIDWLKRANIAVDRENGMELRGELAREYLKTH